MVFVLPLRPLMMPPVMMTLSPFSRCITARLISRFRGPTDIIGLTTNERAYRKLALSWGITPVMSEVYESTDVLFYHALKVSRAVMHLEKGDKVIITGGIINGRSGNTNTIKVEYA